MVKYAIEPLIAKKSAKAAGVDIRVHYKNTWQVANTIRGMTLQKAKQYLKDVLGHKRCVPFVKYNGHVGRTGQAKEFGLTQGRWPEKSVNVVMGLLVNLESNAIVKGLDVEQLVINHVQVNQAPKGRRRTYRAHGRINPFMNNPCHIELFAEEKTKAVAKEANKGQVAKLSKKQQAQQKLTVGEQ